jgi:p24 family protein beta-1
MKPLVRIPRLFHIVYRLFYHTEIVAPIEREIRSMAHSLTSLKDEQEYIMIRERTHRNTAESTNSRVKWWSIIQAVVLFAVVAWQVYYLKVSYTPHPTPPLN